MSSVTNQGGLHSKVLFAFVCMLYACSGACVCVCVGGSELVALCSTMWALDIELRFLRLVRKGLYVLSCEVWIPLTPQNMCSEAYPLSTLGGASEHSWETPKVSSILPNHSDPGGSSTKAHSFSLSKGCCWTNYTSVMVARKFPSALRLSLMTPQ